MKTLFEKLPTEILYLIAEFLLEPVYRPISSLEPYLKPIYAIKNPRLIHMTLEWITQLESDLASVQVNHSRPDIAITPVTPLELLEDCARRLTKNTNPKAFALFRYLVETYHFIDKAMVSQLLQYGSKEALEWVIKEIPLLMPELFDLLLNKSDDAFQLFYDLVHVDCAKEISVVRCCKNIAFRAISKNPSPQALELLESILQKKIPSGGMWEHMLCQSPHFFILQKKYNICSRLNLLMHVAPNPSDETIGFIKENHPGLLESSLFRTNMFSNPNDKVLDYLLVERPEPIPTDMTNLGELVFSLLLNTNPRVESLLCECLDRFLVVDSIDHGMCYSWSSNKFPSVLKKLRANPNWIEWSSLSANPTNEAVDIMTDYPQHVVLDILACNPNPRVLPILIESIYSFDGIQQEDLLEKIFRREDSTELDINETLSVRTNFVNELLSQE